MMVAAGRFEEGPFPEELLEGIRDNVMKFFGVEAKGGEAVFLGVPWVSMLDYVGKLFLNATIEYGSLTPFDKPDIYIPIFYLVEFMCMFGWLKVAETMLNPFGEDDADFDCNGCVYVVAECGNDHWFG